jgi:hypothetical protein
VSSALSSRIVLKSGIVTRSTVCRKVGSFIFVGQPGLLEEICVLQVKLNDPAIPQESVTREIRGMLRGIYVDLIISRHIVCDSGSANRNQDG